MKLRTPAITALACLFLFGSCLNQQVKRFRLVPSGESGITFTNMLEESMDFNIFNYMYFYNGAGVGVGDVNGDGLQDIYFASNQGENKLYLNKGDLKFADASEESGVTGLNGWCTGVTIADVNNDGRLDIYVSYLGDFLIYKGKNQLFINEGNNEKGTPIFRDRAIEYGLDLVGFSTQAVFFDYDRDHDLDMFMLNHSVHDNGTFGKSTLRTQHHPLAGDKLMRNDNGHFIDVTDGSGIYNSALGYGLGVVVSDVNLDGWPDIYVGNDFHENDYLYINQKDGTFKEQLEKSMMHTSRYTMGVDFADFNNDAFPDLIAMDMLPEDPSILKASAAEDAYDVYNFKINYGYNHQFARNTLQLNNHDGTFSEIALFAGVPATDWSWSTLFADFDLDGRKDIFVANGIYRRSNDLDYINFISVDSVQKKIEHEMTERELAYTSKMPQIKIANYIYRNNGDSTFSNVSPEWGITQPSYSNGAAYSDFDNDGDLDLVVNNVEDEAFLYENRTIVARQTKSSVTPAFLKVSLKGLSGNRYGIGAKVFIYNSEGLQMQESMPTRGYQSSVDYTLTFGLGTQTTIDSLIVVWNTGTFQKLTNVKLNQLLTIDEHEAKGNFNYARFTNKEKPLFINVTKEHSLPYRHLENRFVEFNREPLIPHMVSAEGPASAVGDIDNDGLQDVFVGGAKWKQAHVFFQSKNGDFTEKTQPLLTADSTFEDVDGVFFDADNDRDNDLLIVSGGNEFFGRSAYLKPRLYFNDGKGVFNRVEMIDIIVNASCVALKDIDSDGDIDFFLGARSIPWHYGKKPDSYLLLNDGDGKFTNKTDELAPALLNLGMVKNANWCDVDGDKDADLVIAGEWMPITILKNNSGKFVLIDPGISGLEKSNGWWNTIQCQDFDRDGDMDFVAGNLGLNSKLKASETEPVNMYVADFDNNDSTDVVLTHFMKGREYPFNTRDEIVRQMPSLKKRFLSYHKFAEATITDIFDQKLLQKAEKNTVYTFQSSYIENLGHDKFAIRPLPKAAQFSTVNAINVGDFDGDHQIDLLLAGNFFPINIQMGRNDASYGLFLRGNGKGNFSQVPGYVSGFSICGEVRALRNIWINRELYILAIRNNDHVELFKPVILPTGQINP